MASEISTNLARQLFKRLRILSARTTEAEIIDMLATALDESWQAGMNDANMKFQLYEMGILKKELGNAKTYTAFKGISP